MFTNRNWLLWLVLSAFVVGVLVAGIETVRRAQRPSRPSLQLIRSTPEPATWVLPQDDRCPTGFPVKVKESSGIYHLPGGAHYDRVRPDRCYTSAQTATTDGFRRSRT